MNENTLKNPENIPLTRKEQGMVTDMLLNPKMSATDAVEKNYNTSNRNSASVIAAKNMAKPRVKMALEKHVKAAEKAISATIKDWGRSDNTRRREIATQNAQYLHDKVFGKATTRVEMQSQTVAINIDLSGGTAGTPPPELLLDDQQ